jgi:hypothetical protein
MALIKKKRRRKVGRRRLRTRRFSTAYRQGKLDGFHRGKADGYAQGHSNALTATENAEPLRNVTPAVDVLVISAGYIPSLDIGVIQPFDHMRQHGNFQFEVKLDHEVSKEMIAAAKTIVFVRNVEPAAYTLLEWAHELRKRTVYVIDDNFLEIQPTTPVGVYYSDPTIRETFTKFLRNAQIVKVDAPDLGTYIEQKINRKVVYFPASVDFDWLDEQPRHEKKNDQIVIGYEGAAKDEEFAPVVPALMKILDYYGGFVRLEFFGYVPAPLAEHPSVSYEEGGMEYKNFIQKLNMSNWDIGLAPLGDTIFHKGKTNNKMREYGACRIAGIYSDNPVYSRWVTHGESGYLVPHTEEGWYEGLKDMIENPTLRIGIRENAEAVARQLFSLNTCVENWKKYILDTQAGG